MSRARTLAAERLGKASVKIEAIIESCRTRKQLEVARKVVNNWIVHCNYYKMPFSSTDSIREALSIIIGQKALEIYKETNENWQA